MIWFVIFLFTVPIAVLAGVMHARYINGKCPIFLEGNKCPASAKGSVAEGGGRCVKRRSCGEEQHIRLGDERIRS